jgi:hypothetical protein
MELTLGLEVLNEVAKRSLRAVHRIRQVIGYLLATAGRMETDAFQMSFSGNPDELGQWRGYAANGMGCSIVTDKELHLSLFAASSSGRDGNYPG